MKASLGRSLSVAALMALGPHGSAHAQTFVGGSQITPSTTLLPVVPFTINQIADGISAASPFNGFASNSRSGTIHLDFDQPYDLGSFIIWNDINVRAEGIAHFRLDFFDPSLSLIASSPVFLAPQGQVAPATYSFASQFNVKRADLVVLDSNVGLFTRIEIREVGFFTPAVPEPSSYALLVAGLSALVLVKRARATRLAG